jgi:hypothetical protein
MVVIVLVCVLYFVAMRLTSKKAADSRSGGVDGK